MNGQPVIEALLREQAGELKRLRREYRKSNLPMEHIDSAEQTLLAAWAELGDCGQPNGECLCKCHLREGV